MLVKKIIIGLLFFSLIAIPFLEVRAIPPGVGVIGDSATQPYQCIGRGNATSFTWTEVLAAVRGIDFGGEPCEPYNQAWSGETIALNMASQVENVVDDFNSGSIGRVIIMLGHNDLYANTGTPNVNALLATYRTNLETLINAGIAPGNILLIDVSQENWDGPIKPLVDQFNTGLRNLSTEKGTKFASWVAFHTEAACRSTNSDLSYNIGGQIINNAFGDEYHNWRVADGHLGTLANGVFANAIVVDFLGIPRMTDAELLSIVNGEVIPSNPPPNCPPAPTLTPLPAGSSTATLPSSPTGTLFPTSTRTATGTLTATPTPKTSTPSITSTSSTQIPLTPGQYDDTHPQLAYSGGWTSQTVAGAYQNTLHVSNTTGDSVTFKFTGQQLRLMFQSGPSLGIIRIHIGGISFDLDQSNGTEEWISALPSPGTYTVDIQHVSGGSVNIDAIIIPDLSTVTPTITLAPTITPSPTLTPTPQLTFTPVAATLRPYMRSQILAPVSLTTQLGTTSGSLPSLSLLQQTGADDNAATYVSFQTPNGPYYGYQSFTIPEDAQANLVSTLLLQVNFKGPGASTQTWDWAIYDWNTGQWIKIGDSVGTKANEWQALVFRIRQPWQFISSTREIRIQLKSSNANGDAKVDYAALHITYLPIPATPTPVVPVVTPKRPGISSSQR